MALLAPVGATADQGDWSVAGAGSAGLRYENGSVPVRVELTNRLGVSDWFGVEVGGALRHRDRTGLQGEVGLVASADIFQWVPELAVSGIVDYAPSSSEAWAATFGVRGQVRVRYFLSLRSALLIGSGATWIDSSANPFITIGWSRLLN